MKWIERDFSGWTAGLGFLATLSIAMTPLQAAFVALDVLPKEAAITLDGHQQFEAVAVDETGEAVDVTHQVVWTTSDGTNATVADGFATPITRGGCWIFADLGNLRGRAQLVVTSPPKPEDEIIEYHRSVPDPASKDYLSVNEVVHPDVVNFNNAPKTVRSVTISGKTVIIEQGSPLNSLYESYNGAADTLDLAIYAETVIVRDHLSLPQTNVTIYARELRFEDRGNGRPPAALETTPLNLDTRPNEIGSNGAPGLKAGDITLHLETLYSDSSSEYRFVLRGGIGQPAGLGRDGVNGKTFPCCPVILPDICVIYSEVDGVAHCGTKDSPSGEDAISAGNPGNGGSGGVFFCTLPLEGYADLGGGPSGSKGLDTFGGKSGNPVGKTFWLIAHQNQNPGPPYVIEYISVSRDGKDAPAPEADLVVGSSGIFSLIGPITSWLHPSALKAILQHTKDAYLNGNLDYVDTVLTEYAGLIDALGIEAIAGDLDVDRHDVRQIRQEMDDLLQRLAQNLDYFGDPAGWVPMLSFEANFRNFQNEIDTAIPILYLSEWLERAGANAQQTTQALEQARGNLQKEVADFADEYNDAVEKIPRLVVDRDNLANRIVSLQDDLKSLEEELLRRAEKNVSDRHKVPRWKKTLRTLSSITKVIPVGQPYLGAIGTGLDFIASADWKKPLDTFAQAVGVVESFDGTSFKADADKFKAELKALDPRNPDCFFHVPCVPIKTGAIQDIYQDVLARIRSVKDTLKTTQAPQTEVEAELERLKASDPAFTGLVDKIRDLNVQKEEFAGRLAATSQETNRLSSAITKDLVAFDGMSRDLSASYGRLDHRALMYVKEMKARTKERLLKYQYYVAKSFEYRLLKPYQGDFHLNDLFDRLETLVTTPGSGQLLSADQFELLKNVYIEELRRLVAEVIDELNAFPPERSVPISFSLSAAELQELNEKGSVKINLVDRGLFGDLQENLRIVDLRTKDLSVHPVGGNYGDHAILRVRFEHSGISRLGSRGRTYRFQHYRTASVNPITWEAVYDGIDKSIEHSEPSAATESLIRFLLGLNGVQDSERVLLYSRPGAWADIIIRKEVSTDNGIDMGIDGLRLELSYDYQAKPSSQAELSLEVADGLTPYVLLDREDLNGRQDGRGKFRRVFPQNQTVELKAANWYGRYGFEKWTDRFGNDLQPAVRIPVLSLTMSGPMALRAVYTSRCQDLDCSGCFGPDCPRGDGQEPTDSEKAFRLEKGVAKQNAKTGLWSLRASATYHPGSPVLEENVPGFWLVADGAEYFRVGSASSVKAKLDKKTGGVRKLSFRDPARNMLTIDLKSGRLRLSLKNASGLDPSDGVSLSVVLMGSEATLTAPSTIVGKKANKAILSATTGEFVRQ